MANSKEIDKRSAAALAAIKQSAGDSKATVDLFASHHLKEIDAAYWQQQTGTPRPSRDQVLQKLVLRSHWGGDQGIDIFDFTLPNDATNYVISVRFNDNGAVEDISMES